MIQYSFDHNLQASDVAEVFRLSGMKRPFADLERIQRMIDNAHVIVSAWEKGKMIGIARAITDFSYCCYLSDLAVIQQHQQVGVGKQLVQHVQDRIGDECCLLLLAAPGAVDYYPKIGFEKAENAFLIKRKQ